MRHISHALSPRISGSYGFYDAVHEMADSVNSSDQLLMTIDFDESNLPKFSNDQTPMALYRVIAELVNNTLKHAQAKNINLEVMVKENNLMVTYRDDGIGLAQSISTSSTGMGMNNIESRLNLIDADWQLNNPVTGGYEISINVPLN
jgi:signal transduction histidine kinase